MRIFKISQSYTFIDNHSLSAYLNEVKQIPLLTKEEEEELTKKMISGDKLATDKLIRSNLRFVISVAKKYVTDKLLLGDLINEGNIGLIKAAEKFDETRGFKFISYAVWWIRKSILEYISNHGKTIRIPLNRISDINKVKTALNEAELKLGYSVDFDMVEEEIINLLNIKNTDSLNKLFNLEIDSLDVSVQNSESETLKSDLLIGDNNFYEDKIEKDYINDVINVAINNLSERNKLVIRMLFGIGRKQKTLTEVSEILEISESRVKSIRDNALKILKKNKQLEMLF